MLKRFWRKRKWKKWIKTHYIRFIVSGLILSIWVGKPLFTELASDPVAALGELVTDPGALVGTLEFPSIPSAGEIIESVPVSILIRLFSSIIENLQAISSAVLTAVLAVSEIRKLRRKSN